MNRLSMDGKVVPCCLSSVAYPVYNQYVKVMFFSSMYGNHK